jgi:hypothetical protein
MEQVIPLAKVESARQVGRVAMAPDVGNRSNNNQCAIDSASTSLDVGLLHTPMKSNKRVDGVACVPSAMPAELPSNRPPPKISFGFYASPHFLGRYGRPASPEDLKSGRFMTYKRGAAPTAMVLRNTVSGCRSLLASGAAIESPCAIALVKAAVRGLGVVFVPHHIAESALNRCELVQVMHEWESS